MNPAAYRSIFSHPDYSNRYPNLEVALTTDREKTEKTPYNPESDIEEDPIGDSSTDISPRKVIDPDYCPKKVKKLTLPTHFPTKKKTKHSPEYLKQLKKFESFVIFSNGDKFEGDFRDGKFRKDCKLRNYQTKKIQWYRVDPPKEIKEKSDLLSLKTTRLVKIKLDDGRTIEGYSDESGIGGPALQTFPSGNTFEGTFKNGKFAGDCKYTNTKEKTCKWYRLIIGQEVKNEKALSSLTKC